MVCCSVFNGHPVCTFSKTSVLKLVQMLSHRYPAEGVAHLSVAFLTESIVGDLHRQFLNDASPTDVITFPLSDGLAEICINVDLARKRIHEFHTTFQDEITLYLVHGWLHLAGHDDRDWADRQKMRAAERHLCAFLGETNFSLHYRPKNFPSLPSEECQIP
jgi:probable rRNA maturation factor